MFTLTGWDLGFLTVLLFGPAIWSSFSEVRAFAGEDQKREDPGAYGVKENLQALAMQLLQLFLAIGYLIFRGFDFSNLVLEWNISALLWGVGLFLLAGFLMDLWNGFSDGFSWIPNFLKENIPLLDALRDTDLSLGVYSVLNGVYEEFFFLCMITAVKPEFLPIAFAFSLLIRFLFHTYQGVGTAMGMTLILGVGFFVLYTGGMDNLLIFFVAHALCDFFGMSLINLL